MEAMADMEVMVDTVAREKQKLPQLHTMADMVDMDMEAMADMEVMVDTVAREKQKLPQLHTMVDMVMGDMVDTEDTVDIVESVMPNHTMVMEVVMAVMEVMVMVDMDGESKPTIINLNPRLSRQLSTSSHQIDIQNNTS